MDSPGTKSSETPAEAQGIAAVIAGLSPMATLRAGVENRALSPLTALQDYSAGILNEPRLFLDEADSLTNATAASQALGLIATVSAREALSQEYALLSGMLAAHRESQADRAALAAMAATRQADVIDANYVLDASQPAHLQQAGQHRVPERRHRRRRGGVGRHLDHQAADHRDPVAGAVRPGARRVLHRRRERGQRPARRRPPDQPRRRGPGSRSRAPSACSGCSSRSR